MNYEDLEQNLPDAFRKEEESNNYKILKVNRNTFDEINSAFKVMLDALNINSATGQALDDIYGGRLNLPRGSLNDDQYRIRLKGRMMKNIVDGSFNAIINALAYILQCDTEDLKLQENGDGTVSILNTPLEVLTDAGFDYLEAVTTVEEMLPMTVTVDSFTFTGEKSTTVYAAPIGVYDRQTQVIPAAAVTVTRVAGAVRASGISVYDRQTIIVGS